MCIYFHEGTENCSFEMAAPPAPPTGWLTLPKSPLHLQGLIHRPSAAGSHLPRGSLALSPWQHCIAVKLHREPWLGATMGCRKTRACHIARDSCSFQRQKEPATWFHMGGNEKWIQFGAEKRYDQRKDNSPHCGKGWAKFFGRRQCRWTRQMVGVVPPDLKNLLSLCTSPQTWGTGRSQQAITWVHCSRKAVGLKLCTERFLFLF